MWGAADTGNVVVPRLDEEVTGVGATGEPLQPAAAARANANTAHRAGRLASRGRSSGE